MVGKQILDEKSVSIPEVKKILDTLKEKGELRYEQRLALNYVENFAKIGVEDAAKLSEELTSLNIPRIKEEHIAKIVDILPRNYAELNILLAKDKISLKKDIQNKIIEVIDKYCQE